MVVAFYFRLHLAYFPRPVVAIFARPEQPAISFDGTTANCRVSVSADRSTDQISAVIQLWNGSTRIARWTDSGTGYLLFSNSATVSKGKTYELTVDVKINGVSKPQVSIEGTCK